MYKISLLSICLLFSASVLAERLDSAYLGYRGHRLEALSQALDLTSEQKNKLEVIFKEQTERVRTINEQAHKQIIEVLNADQVLKLENINKHKQEKRLKRSGAE